MSEDKSGILTLDFSTAPPKQGGGLVLIPPGPYVMLVTDAEMGESNSGNPQVIVTMTVAEGPHYGEEFKDYFSPVPPRPGDKMTGLSKFNFFLHACNLKPGPKIRIDIKKTLPGKKVIANVGTEPMKATEQYPDPRDVSKIKSYELPAGHVLPAENGAAPAKSAQAAPAPAAAPVAAPAAIEAPEEASSAVVEGVTVDAEEATDMFE